MSPEEITFPTVSDERGHLSVADIAKDVPIEVERLYWVWGIPEQAERGGHAHREQTEVLVAMAGAFSVRLTGQDGTVLDYRLDRPDGGLVVPPMYWREVMGYEPGSVMLAISDGRYDPDEYLREKDVFLSDAG
ncbi:MAG: FdtA/QdtA family cupin domain-containing protein [Verrucomicrobiota bacterium]